MNPKTAPKKNADWFCEKCKGQENGEAELEIDEKGLKPNAWQTPAQRKAYSGQPTVNPAKTKEFNVKPPDGIGKKNAAKVGKDAAGKKKAELNHTPSRSGLRDFLGSAGESEAKAGSTVEPGNLKRKTKQSKRDESPKKQVKKAKAMPAHVPAEETASDLQTTSNLLEAVSPVHLTSSITSTTSSMMPPSGMHDVVTQPKSVKDSTSPKPVAVPISIAQAKSPLAGLSIKGQVQVRVRSPEGVPIKSRLANLPIAVVQSRSPEHTGAPSKLAGLPITVALATSPRKMIVSSPATTLPIMSTAAQGIVPGSKGSPVKALDLTTVGLTKVLSLGLTTNPPRLATGSTAMVRTILSPGMTRSPLVGAGLGAVRPRMPSGGATRPSLVAVRSKQPSLRLVTRLPPGVRPNIPLSRPTLLVARPGLRPVRPMTKPNVSQALPVTLANIVRSPPTSTKPVSVGPMLNKAASDEDIVMLADTDTESFEDLPNNMIKLIKVNEDKDSSSKEKTEEERMDDESFMDMFDDETRKLAETFDMFEPTGSSKNGDDNDSTKKTMEDGKTSEELSPTGQSAQTTGGGSEQNETAPQAPDTPGTPGTPRLMICTPGASPPFGASPSFGALASGSPPTPTGQRGGVVRLRGMRPRGGQVVAIRGGSALRLRMPLRVPIRGGVASLAVRPRGLVSSRMKGSGPMTGRPALLRPTNPRQGAPRAMLTRPSAPRPVLVRPKLPPTTATASGSVQTTSETSPESDKEPTEILMTKDTTPAHPKKEAAEVIDLGEETTPPSAPKRKATMAKLTHLGISVSRKKGEKEGSSTSHTSLPQAVAQSPSVTKPASASANASSKKVTVELSESQIKALKALGMM